MFVPSTLQTNEKLEENKQKSKVKKGWVAVKVGLEEQGGLKTFDIPISDLCHPLYRDMLEKAQEIYGCNITGPLRLPCTVEEFLDLRSKVEQETSLPQLHHTPQVKYIA